MVNEHDVVALTQDLPAEGLHKGDVGAVVHCYKAGEIYEVEFVDERGRTKRIASVAASQLMKLNLVSLTA
jgi:hypothetical protein